MDELGVELGGKISGGGRGRVRNAVSGRILTISSSSAGGRVGSGQA